VGGRRGGAGRREGGEEGAVGHEWNSLSLAATLAVTMSMYDMEDNI